MTLAILLSLKTMELLGNGVATHFQSTLLLSMRTESQASFSEVVAALMLTLGVSGPLYLLGPSVAVRVGTWIKMKMCLHCLPSRLVSVTILNPV